MTRPRHGGQRATARLQGPPARPERMGSHRPPPSPSTAVRATPPRWRRASRLRLSAGSRWLPWQPSPPRPDLPSSRPPARGPLGAPSPASLCPSRRQPARSRRRATRRVRPRPPAAPPSASADPANPREARRRRTRPPSTETPPAMGSARPAVRAPAKAPAKAPATAPGTARGLQRGIGRNRGGPASGGRLPHSASAPPPPHGATSWHGEVALGAQARPRPPDSWLRIVARAR
mmetsp:Transcript_14859/g.42818  ORF Transcript_14859/g.42818 Transcript_14859/m.42818 type:complete len:233 (-) Transcript_14859:32-730(-)